MRQSSEFFNLIRGFTLLEVLVTLVVLSVGLLGLTSLQLRSLQYSHASYQRTLASIYAKDMAERLWTNLANPTSMVSAWQADLATKPGTWSGTVTRTAAPAPTYPNPRQPDIYDITVTWTDSRFGASTYSFNYRTRLLRVQPPL